ncbi:C4-type zinc ribbon domain-containing protein [Demequina sp.]|uniref:zinc ribbon domain-containing protein n=1 Tax=Demequina sp. TaxID=2050685 RepID=UPI0025BC1199|nr:C4-type zinc ribbon domain-containing protein [Demequina sp.]
MPKAPVADQLRLLTVQDLDTKLAQARHRLVNLPARQELDEVTAEAASLEETRVEAATAVTDLRREVTKAEDDVVTVRARADRDNQRMLSGAGLAPKELQALQSELEVLAKRQGDLEEIELDAMQRLEDAEAEATRVIMQIDAVAAKVADITARLHDEAADIDAEIVSLSAGRANAAAGLDEGLLALYEKLRVAHGGTGAATLQHGACQGCNMSLNPADLAHIEAAPEDDIVRCEECGRILVRGAGS